MAIHRRSGDCQSNSGVRGYAGVWDYLSAHGPGIVRVTPVYEDTLTCGWL